MEQFDLYVHGVPVGHEICGCNEELDYIKGFYNHDEKVEVSTLLQIDIVNGKSFYTYLRKKNVRNAEGRPGSYFGLTVSFSDRYCTNVQMLYEILDAIYKQICIDCLIKPENGVDRFLVKQISTASYKNQNAVDYIKRVFKNNIENLHFDNLNGSSSSKAEEKFSLMEVDSPLFHETLQQRRILVSPEYKMASVAYNNLLKELEPIQDENERLKTANTQLANRKDSLYKEVERLENELSDITASASKKYKKQLEELQKELKDCKEEKDKLDAKIKEATSAVDLIDEPFKKLARLLASRFQDKDEKIGKKSSEKHSACRTQYKETKWSSMGNIILLLVVAALCGYCCYAVSQLSKSVNLIQNRADTRTTVDTVSVNSEIGDETVVNDNVDALAADYYKDYRIDITPSPVKDTIIRGTVYTLSIKKKNGREMVSNLNGFFAGSSGIEISGNTFSTNNVSNINNVQIYYTVNNRNVITRTLIIK